MQSAQIYTRTAVLFVKCTTGRRSPTDTPSRPNQEHGRSKGGGMERKAQSDLYNEANHVGSRLECGLACRQVGLQAGGRWGNQADKIKIN